MVATFIPLPNPVGMILNQTTKLIFRQVYPTFRFDLVTTPGVCISCPVNKAKWELKSATIESITTLKCLIAGGRRRWGWKNWNKLISGGSEYAGVGVEKLL